METPRIISKKNNMHSMNLKRYNVVKMEMIGKRELSRKGRNELLK